MVDYNGSDVEKVRTCILHVCTSCRPTGMPREPKENRAGFILHQQLLKLIGESSLGDRVDVRPAECLSICPRPCGIALSSEGAWSYLFGDQMPEQTAQEIVECLSVYLKAKKGFMSRQERPKSLRSSILGRVPSVQSEQKCT